MKRMRIGAMTATRGNAMAMRRRAIVRAMASRRLARRLSDERQQRGRVAAGAPCGAVEAVETGSGRFGGLCGQAFEDIGGWGA